MGTRLCPAAAALLLPLAAIALGPGCRSGDDGGPSGTGAAKAGRPERIVSLIPNATEILFDMGLGDLVVGVTRYCDRPPEARDLPKVGGILDVSTEAVLSLRPDLVIGSPAVLRGGLAGVLRASGASILPLDFDTMESVARGITAIGEAAGRPGAARAMLDRFRRTMAALRGRAAGKPRIKVLFVAGVNPLVVAGRGSFIGELLELAGLDNVAGAGSVPYPTWSMEQVIRASPDVVIDGTMGRSGLASMLAGAGLSGTGLITPSDEAIVRPGPSAVRAAMDLVDRIAAAASHGPSEGGR